MTALQLILLASGGLAAGVINTLAGGGSLLTVPLLVWLGMPGMLANGTNRIGIVVQNAASSWGFMRRGVGSVKDTLPILAPVGLGALLGAIAVSNMSDSAFERIFGIAMLVMLVPTLRRPKLSFDGHGQLPKGAHFLLFFVIGLYGGAFQAGVGILLLLALSRAGHDLVTANSIKVMLTLAFNLAAVPVFIAKGQVVWLPAVVLACGFAAGGELGAHVAVKGGESLIKPVLAVAIVALAVKMLGLI